MKLHPIELDEFAARELSPAKARDVEAHVVACSSCTSELDWLQWEKRLFDSRRRSEIPALHGFAQVRMRLAVARYSHRPLLRRFWPLPVGLCAALLLTLAPAVRHLGARDQAVFNCSGQSTSASIETPWCPSTPESSGQISDVEARYQMCLIATPSFAPDRLL